MRFPFMYRWMASTTARAPVPSTIRTSARTEPVRCSRRSSSQMSSPSSAVLAWHVAFGRVPAGTTPHERPPIIITVFSSSAATAAEKRFDGVSGVVRHRFQFTLWWPDARDCRG